MRWQLVLTVQTVLVVHNLLSVDIEKRDKENEREKRALAGLASIEVLVYVITYLWIFNIQVY